MIITKKNVLLRSKDPIGDAPLFSSSLRTKLRPISYFRLPIPAAAPSLSVDLVALQMPEQNTDMVFC